MNSRQRRFCEEYLVDMNATQAAIRAGYQKAGAHVQGARLLTNPKVAEEIARLKSERSARTKIEADHVLSEIALLAFSDLADFVEYDDGQVKVKPFDKMPAHARRAISEITQKGDRVTIKLYDKPRSLKMLSDHLGLDAPKTATINVEAAIHKLLDDLKGQLEHDAFVALLKGLEALGEGAPNGD